MPLVTAHEASLAPLQAIDGTRADIHHHMAESGHVTAHIAIPVVVASDPAIQVQGDLEHGVTLYQTVQQSNSTHIDSSAHDLHMSNVQVVSTPQTTVVTSAEAVTETGQLSQTVVVTSPHTSVTTTHTTVTVPSQAGGLAIAQQEKGQWRNAEDKLQNNGHKTSDDNSLTSKVRTLHATI